MHDCVLQQKKKNSRTGSAFVEAFVFVSVKIIPNYYTHCISDAIVSCTNIIENELH